MTARYLRNEDYDRSLHWISVGNLRRLLEGLADDCGIETSDLSDLLVSESDDYIGYIALKNGDGTFVTFKSIMDSLSVEEK